MKYKLRRFIDYIRYDIIQGIRNLILYAPVIWQTREWDHAYLYRLMAFKLKQMEKDHRENQIIADWEKVANQMQIARVSLERMAEDEYPGFKEFCHIGNIDDMGKEVFRQKMKRDEEMFKEDLERFTNEFKRHSRGWWS